MNNPNMIVIIMCLAEGYLDLVYSRNPWVTAFAMLMWAFAASLWLRSYIRDKKWDQRILRDYNNLIIRSNI